jgi:hypothetical protein
MYKNGEVIADHYTVVMQLEPVLKTEYYLTVDEAEQRYVAAVRYFEQSEDIVAFGKKVRGLHREHPAGFAAESCHRSEEDRVIVLCREPAGISLKKKLILNGRLERRQALKTALQVTRILGEQLNSHGRILSRITAEMVYVTEKGAVTLLGVESLEKDGEASPGAEAELVFSLGVLFYQICSGDMNTIPNDLRSSRKAENLTVPAGAGKEFAWVIKDALQGWYDKVDRPLHLLEQDLWRCRVRDGLSAFLKRGAREASSGKEAERQQTPSNVSVRTDPLVEPADDSPTIRLDVEPEENDFGETGEILRRGKFDIVRNEIWINTGEFIGNDY